MSATESTPAASPAAAPAAAAVVPVASPTPAVATPATPAAGAPPAAEPAPAARKGCCGGRRKAAPAKPAEPKVKFGELFRYSTPFDRAMMAIACVAAAGNGVIFPCFTVLFGELLNSLNAPMDDFVREIQKYSLYFLIIAVASGIAAFLEVALPMVAAERQVRRLREDYLRALLRQDMEWFDTNRAGEVASRMAEDSILVMGGIAEQLPNTIHYLITFVAGIVVAFTKAPYITLVVLCVLPFIIFIMTFLRLSTMRFESASAAAYARAGDAANEAFSQIRTVAAFGGEAAEVDRYDTHLAKAENANKRKGFFIGAAVGGIFASLFMAYGVAAWVGVNLIAASREENPQCAFNPALAGCFSGGNVINALMSAIIGAFSLGQAAPNFSAFGSAQAAAYKMYSVIGRKPKIDVSSPKGAKPAKETLTGRIEFRNVTFRYPSRPSEVILSNFSLVIEPGKTYAFVGASGCGKSTLMALVQRLYDPEEGTVLMDGVDVKEWNLAYLRDRVAIVSQEPTLFAASVRENIAYGKPTDAPPATDAEIEAATRAANAHDFITALPEGFHTIVGTSVSSTQLSGGQRQRCCIARAILRNPTYLLLDEATSALDTHSERVVQAALDKLVAGDENRHRRTTLVIAHRLSTITNADAIIVMKKGAIVERGTHAELMAIGAGGLYHELRSQQDLHAAKNALHGHHHHHKDASAAGAASAAAVTVTIDTHPADATAVPVGSAAPPSITIPPPTGDAAIGTQPEPSPIASSPLSPASPATPAGSATPAPGKAAAAAAATTSTGKEEEDTFVPPPVPAGRVWALQAPDWPWMVAGLLGSCASGVMQPIFSIVYSGMITIFYNPNSAVMKDDMKPYVGYFFAVAIGLWIANTVRIGSFVLLGETLTRKLRTMTFKAVLRQDMAFFDNPRNAVGRLNTRLAADAADVKGGTGEALSLVFQAGAAIVAGLIISFVACWQLALVLTGILPFMIVAALMQGKAFKGFSIGAAKALEEAGHIATEATSAIRTVSAFNLQPQMMATFSKALEGPQSAGVKKALAAGAGQGFSQGFQFIAFSLGFYAGGNFIKLGLMDFQALMRVFMAITMAAQAAGNAINWGPDQSKATLARRRLFHLIDLPKKIDPMDETKGIKPAHSSIEGRIEFADVSFAYPTRQERKVLDKLSLSVQPGQKVALVGSSGCGKSTIIQLLLRFYDPDAGTITLDGVPIQDYNVQWLRAHYGLVQQEPSLFADSVRYNIEYGRAGSKPKVDQGITPEKIEAEKTRVKREMAAAAANNHAAGAAAKPTEITDEAVAAAVNIKLTPEQETVPSDVLDAARAAHAASFIGDFKYKYATHCGSKGMELSGGQRSRIAIARALVRDPRVLLLDEATAALDSTSEAIVQQALDDVLDTTGKNAAGKATERSALVIAHRLSTVRNSDLIVVMDKGKKVELGTHDALMAKEDGLYRALALAQDGSH